MEKPRLGPHLFRPFDPKEAHPPMQACTVVALNEDGSARLLVHEADGSSSFLEKGYLLQAEGDYLSCYTDRAPEPDEPVDPREPT